MTYREYLAQLLDKVIEKSEQYFEIGHVDNVTLSGYYVDKLRLALEECTAAKTAYHAFLEFISTNAIDLDDRMAD